MKITPIHTGFLKLDGGAMFGIVPKTMWQKLNPPDEQNKCTWSMRCLLVETAGRKILIDTGIGDKQDDKFRRIFEPHGSRTLQEALRRQGIHPGEITDVLLTHLHFDHVGGAIQRDASGRLTPAFPNAVYWSNKRHWDWAMQPNEREKASFLKENFVQLQAEGLVQFIEPGEGWVPWMKHIDLYFAYGHTEAMMIPKLNVRGRTFIYPADLIPSVHHIGMPYIMAYDVRPLDTLREKAWLLQEALEQDAALIFEHDPAVTAAKVQQTEGGRIISGATWTELDALLQ